MFDFNRRDIAIVSKFETHDKTTNRYCICIFVDDDCTEPHFHIIGENNDFHACFGIIKKDYLYHDGAKDRCNPTMKVVLCTLLNYVKPGNCYNTWENICMTWNWNNEGFEVDTSFWRKIPSAYDL